MPALKEFSFNLDGRELPLVAVLVGEAQLNAVISYQGAAILLVEGSSIADAAVKPPVSHPERLDNLVKKVIDNGKLRGALIEMGA